MLTKETIYLIPEPGTTPMQYRPVIIGSGPAGLFAGLFLAREGYRPIILERGMAVDERTACVNGYWKKEHPLNPNCNVQFGEGGAGTFSDGKLNTVIKDKSGRRTAVLKTFVEFGADPSILYVNKPHIGTDVLLTVVKNIRNEIIRLGGEVRFEQLVTDIEVIDSETTLLHIKKLLKPEDTYELKSNAVILAIGHSARDTFEMLYKRRSRLQWDSGSNIQEPLSMKHNMDIIPIMKIYCRQQIISWCIRQQTDGRSTPSVCVPVVTL